MSTSFDMGGNGTAHNKSANERPIPRKVLEGSLEARIGYFADKILFHPKLREVHTRLLRAIRHELAPLIMVYGPTGVGKTTLRQKIEAEINQIAQSEPSFNPGCIPIAGVSANSSGNGNFDWRDFLHCALVELNEPMIEHKLAYRPYNRYGWGVSIDAENETSRPMDVVKPLLPGFSEWLSPTVASSTLSIPITLSSSVSPALADIVTNTRAATPKISMAATRTMSITELRRIFEQALHYRGVRALIVDEAQHLRQMSSGRRLLDQMNYIKTLANNTSVVYVLVGTYDLLDLNNLSDQLSRRSVDIHFSRYLSDNKGMSEFSGVVYSFQRHLPLAQEPDLISHLDECYEYSAGCVGLLKEWLRTALAETLALGRETMNWRHVREYVPEERKRHSIALEIDRGERRLRDSGDDTHRTEIRRLLGIRPSSVVSHGNTNESMSAEGKGDSKNDKSNTAQGSLRKRGRVGQRNPTRDPVGRGAPFTSGT